jgi:hypothetical protein
LTPRPPDSWRHPVLIDVLGVVFEMMTMFDVVLLTLTT